LVSWRSLYASALLFAAFCVAALALTVPSHAMVDMVSGTWTALAIDVRDGVWYRPLLGPDGYGGTRYFPLWLILDAGLMRLGLSPLAAGHAISLVSALALVVGARRLLRSLEVPPGAAWSLAMLTLCTSAGMLALTTVRGDLLPAALSMWGLACTVAIVRDRRPAQALAVAAALFSLAIFAKPTSIYAVAAAVAVLAVNGRASRGWTLAGLAAALAAAMVLAVNVASGGRMFETLRACASSGATFWNIVHAPLAFLYTLAHQDPMTSVIVALFVAALCLAQKEIWHELPTWAAVASLAALVAVNASPGIDFNHDVDFLAFALLFVGFQVARNRLPGSLTTLALAAAATLSIVLFFYNVRELRRLGQQASIEPVRAYLRELDGAGDGGPVSSDNALFPSVDGRRSSLVDPFMFQLLRRRDARFERDLESRLTSQRFSAIVLQADSQTDVGRAILADLFGDRFMSTLESQYALAKRFPPYSIYRPIVR